MLTDLYGVNGKSLCWFHAQMELLSMRHRPILPPPSNQGHPEKTPHIES